MKQKPLVTVYVPLFNRRTLVSDALQSVFSQTYSPLEIIICDDCSSDGSMDIVQERVSQYKGVHEVHLHRNERNLGLVGNINNVFKLARGELIVINCDDDLSEPNRIERIVSEWVRYGKKPFVVYSSFRHISKDGYALEWPIPPIKDGLVKGSVTDFLKSPQVVGCTAAYRPELMTLFPPIGCREAHDDYVLFFRGRLLGDILSISDPLLYYRDGGVSANHGTVESIWIKPFRAWLASYKQLLADLNSVAHNPGRDWNREELTECLQSLVLTYEARLALVSAPLYKRIKAFLYLARCPEGQPKIFLFALAVIPRSLVKVLVHIYFLLFAKKGH